MFGKTYLNKIFIDSRYKTENSASDSDFVVELNETIELSGFTGCIVSDITLPHTWYNINSLNSSFYFRTTLDGVSTDYTAILPTQNYNLYELAVGLTDAMNAHAGGATFKVESDKQEGTLKINMLIPGLQIQIFTDSDLSTRVNGTWRGPFFQPSNLKSLNSVLRINGKQLQTYTSTTPYTTGCVDLLPLHSVYLTSTKLSNYSNLGPAGQRNVIKKIVITSGFGDMNTSLDLWNDDRVDVSGLSIKLLDFQLRDAFGNVIDLNGGHVSFSLCFVKN